MATRRLVLTDIWQSVGSAPCLVDLDNHSDKAAIVIVDQDQAPAADSKAYHTLYSNRSAMVFEKSGFVYAKALRAATSSGTVDVIVS